jgi:hypothetical protein
MEYVLWGKGTAFKVVVVGCVFQVTVASFQVEVILSTLEEFCPIEPMEVTAPLPSVGPLAERVRKAPSTVASEGIELRSNFINPRLLFTPPWLPGWETGEQWIAEL